MDNRIGIEQVASIAACGINRGWLPRLQSIVDSYSEYSSQTLEIGGMSLGGRRLGQDSDILMCVEFVAERGMEITARVPGLDSCFKYCPSVAQFLLNRGFDPNITDGRGNTGLHYMAEIGYVSAVRKLLSHGADSQHKNDDGLTAWNVANEEGNLRTRKCLEGQEVDSCNDMEIRWFSRRRGYGYIRNSIFGDIYFEHSCEPGCGIEEGTRLEFHLGCDDFGPTADGIHI